MNKKVKLLLINFLYYIFILIVIELFAGYFLQYRYSHKGFQTVELLKKAKFKLFRNTKNKFFLDKPNQKFSKLINLRNNNEDNIFPSYNYDPQLHDPNGYYWFTNPINSKIIFCKERSGLIEYDTNKFGFRSINKVNQKNPFKYIFIGDSITEGACVKDESTIPQYFSKLRKENTINAGKSHTGPLFQLALLTELLKYNQDVEKILSNDSTFVWILFAGNDLYNLVEEKTTLLSNYLNDGYSQNYFQNIAYISKSQKLFLNEFIDLIENYSLRSFNRFGYGETVKYEWMAKRNQKIFKEVMKIFSERVENAGSNLKVVIITHHDQPVDSVMKVTEKFIDENCKDLEIDCTKIEVPSKKLNIERKEMINYHFSEKGYETLAEIISESF